MERYTNTEKWKYRPRGQVGAQYCNVRVTATPPPDMMYKDALEMLRLTMRMVANDYIAGCIVAQREWYAKRAADGRPWSRDDGKKHAVIQTREVCALYRRELHDMGWGHISVQRAEPHFFKFFD